MDREYRSIPVVSGGADASGVVSADVLSVDGIVPGVVSAVRSETTETLSRLSNVVLPLSQADRHSAHRLIRTISLIRVNLLSPFQSGGSCRHGQFSGPLRFKDIGIGKLG